MMVQESEMMERYFANKLSEFIGKINKEYTSRKGP